MLPSPWLGCPAQSEAERQELGAAGGVAIHKCSKTDLMGDAGSRQSFGDHTDHQTQHGGTSVEPLNPLELLQMNVACSSRLKPLVTGLIGLHVATSIDTKCNAVLTTCHGVSLQHYLLPSAFPRPSM